MYKTSLSPDRHFTPEQAGLAAELYRQVADLPLVCPHGHVDPRLFADPDYSFSSPTDLLILPDHYIFRMLYSLGIPLEQLGIQRRDGGPIETDPRRIWGAFAEHFHLFRGTPSGIWLQQELETVFGVDEDLTAESAWRVYDRIADCLNLPEFRPRALFERFKIEVLCTTDEATDDLHYHQSIRASGWSGRVIPTFRPDRVFGLAAPGWMSDIAALSAVSGIEVGSYTTFIQALEQRRAFFKQMGAVAADHAVMSPLTAELFPREAEAIFQRALCGEATPDDAARFSAHMLMESARMSVEDGLVMQLHAGALRNHNMAIYSAFGPDMGADIPVQVEFTRNLRALLNKFGNDARLTLILFTLDETTYARELAPLAGHYPAIKLGPPWWFHDSPNGMRRYFDQVLETAGLYNIAGFNDDTRAFCSIPARHDLWRRISADWLAGLVARHIVGMDAAGEMMAELAVGLARRAYRL